MKIREDNGDDKNDKFEEENDLDCDDMINDEAFTNSYKNKVDTF